MRDWVSVNALAGACLLLVAACGESEVVDVPPPLEPTRAAIGHYCSMTVVDHPGPKGQVHLQGKSQPVWFSSVRDTIAFTMLPEESKDIAVIYVNDMARAKTWQKPEPDTWIRAGEAWYVLGSSQRGGMGAPEAVPFGDKRAAQSFADHFGGRIVAFKDIPTTAILGPADDGTGQQAHMGGGASGHDQGKTGMDHGHHNAPQPAPQHGAHQEHRK